ncbi:MAG: amidohydrolase family protein, partial [Actinobacteria bacterium]|nr:amidohydrolase family protein [Actinomycetota bacterium]
ENSKLGIYKKILRETSNIKVALTQCCRTDVDDDKKDPLLIPIMPLWLGCGLIILPEIDIRPKTVSWKDFQNSLIPWSWCNKDWKYKSTDIKTLDDCLENQEKYLKKIKSERAVGVKFSTYNTKINSIDKPDRKKAEQIFNDFKKGKIKKLPQANDLHYYLLDKAISFAVKEGFVLSVHTGYWGDFRDLSPLNVIPFIIKNPDGKFDLYHLGYPWIRESIMIGKVFPNVYIDLCWVHIISQKAAREAMDEIIETIPTNKVIGFGGDYTYESIENIFSHLVVAKDNIAEVISNRISRGFMDFDSGIEIIKKYFYYNPKNLYNLKL